MNERIEQLAEQCWTHINEPLFGAKSPHWEFDRQKFAELIIQECARIAARTPCPYEDEFAKQTYGHTWDMACVESAKEIRKHFGVEG